MVVDFGVKYGVGFYGYCDFFGVGYGYYEVGGMCVWVVSIGLGGVVFLWFD